MGYFYGKRGTKLYTKCDTYNDITSIGGSVVENDDGTVSVYTPKGPLYLDNFCCTSLKSGYYYDTDNQTCRWSTIGKVCSLDRFKLTLNPIGNDGNIFYIDKNINNTEKCSLNIEFDYIFKVSCESLTNILVKNDLVTTNANGCSTPIDVLENLDVSVLLEYVDSANKLVTVETYSLFEPIGTGNLYNYLTTNTNSGFLVCGEPNSKEKYKGITGCTPIYLESNSSKNVSTCNGLIENIVNGLLTQSTLDKATFDTSFNKNSLASNWLHYQTTVSDDIILSKIENKKIKISIQVNSLCGEFCILLDNIKLNRDCSLVTENNMFISMPPSFDLTRIIDNKKSWVANTTPENRPFGITNVSNTNPIRQTKYDVNDERLVINTKEIDLDISIASGIETDVWCYISDNPCLLTATTTTTNCGCTTLSCFKDYFNIKDFRDSSFYTNLDDLHTFIRERRDNWFKLMNERDLAVGPYYTVSDSPYSSIYNDDLNNILKETKAAYLLANKDVSTNDGGYIFGFSEKPNKLQYNNEPVHQILKTDCGDVMTILNDDVGLYFVSNEFNELEVYVQDITGIQESTTTLVSLTPLVSSGNVDNSDTLVYSGTPQLYCTFFGNLVNQYSELKKSNVNYYTNQNVNIKSNGSVFNNDDLFYVRWDSNTNKCLAKNIKAFPEAFSVNYIKQDYNKFCKRYSTSTYDDCIINATGDKTMQNSTLVTTFTGDTTYTTLGDYTITNILDTSLITVNSYVYGDGITWGSTVVSVTPDSVTLDKICTITATGVSLENWTNVLDKEYNLKSIYSRQHINSINYLNLNISLARQRNYLTSVIDSNGDIPDEPYVGPDYDFIPIDVTTTIRKDSISGDIVYQESYRLNDPTSLSDLGVPTTGNYGYGLANLKIPIGVAYTNGFQYNTNPLASTYNTYESEVPFGTYITGSTAGLPFFDSGNNTSDAIDYKNEYYVHLDIVDTSGNTYYATNNDFNLKDSNGLIKFPTTASTQTLDINSVISAIDTKKQEFLDARDGALKIIVKNGGCVNC